MWRPRCPLLLLLYLSMARASGVTHEEAFTQVSTALRAHLLANQDKSVPPTSTRVRRPGNQSQAGTDVSMEMRFFKIDFVDPSTGSMQVKVWMRLQWYDTRLSWDRGTWNVSYIYVNHPQREEPEIWTPDITAYNERRNSFDGAYARVDSTGRVLWSRPGMLDIMCKFSNLAQFPFDRY